MKRCPECRRDYNDETLNFCLDDGAALVNGPASMDEPTTALLSGSDPEISGETARLPSGSSGNRYVPLPGRNLAGRMYPSPEVPLRKFVLSIPWESGPNWDDFLVAISPDGSRIVYNWRQGNKVSICLRNFDSVSVQSIAEGRDAYDCFFSPDGEWIGIADEVGLSKVSIRGGQPQLICRWPGDERAPKGFSWGSDGYILFGTSTGIQRISTAGGSAEVVTGVEPGHGVSAHFWPSHMPDGKSALITIIYDDGSETGGLVSLKDGSVQDLGINGRGFVFVETHWIAFQQGTTLLAVPFNSGHLPINAHPAPIIQEVRTRPAIARDGTLAYIPTRGESNAGLVWVDRDGRPTPVGNERLDYTHLDLAPDGRHALLNLSDERIDLIDLQGGTRKLVAMGAFPIWSSDGERVTFKGEGGLSWVPVDGSAPPQLLVQHNGFVVPTSWNAITNELAYYDHRAFEIWIRSADGTTRRFLGSPGRKRSGRFSPDGNWMAYVSDETGDYQVYVTAYPGPGATVAVSTKGGLSPLWSADGRELFFRLGSKMLSARMISTQPLAFDPPAEIFDGPYTLDLMGHQREDVACDGQKFLMVENSDDFPIVIVQNWPLELERLVR